jgi:hypothetical protein
MTNSILSMISQEVAAEECLVGDRLHLGRMDAGPRPLPNRFTLQSAPNVPDPISVYPSIFLAHGVWADRIQPPSGAGFMAIQYAADSVPDHFIDWGQHIAGKGLSAWSSSTSGSDRGFPQPSEAGLMSGPRPFICVPPPSAEIGTQDFPSQTREQDLLGTIKLSTEQSEVGGLLGKPRLFSTLDAVDERKPSIHIESVNGEANGVALHLQMIETVRVLEQVRSQSITFEVITNNFESC